LDEQDASTVFSFEEDRTLVDELFNINTYSNQPSSPLGDNGEESEGEGSDFNVDIIGP
jgi:hypothetical protein